MELTDALIKISSQAGSLLHELILKKRQFTVVGFFSFFSPFTVFYNLYNFFFSERSGCSSEEHLEEAVRENYNFVKRAFNRS